MCRAQAQAIYSTKAPRLDVLHLERQTDRSLLLHAGWIHSRPEPLYFWFYFVVVNGIWVVIPGIIAVASAARLCRAMAFHDRCGQLHVACLHSLCAEAC